MAGTGGIPTNNWMRDDCLGGTAQVAPVFEDLYRLSAFDLALSEKENATLIWTEIVASTSSLQAAIPDTAGGGTCSPSFPPVIVSFLSLPLSLAVALGDSGYGCCELRLDLYRNDFILNLRCVWSAL
jgi:hypothetical protein